MSTYIITGGRNFGDISDKALEIGSVEYHQRFMEYKWTMEQLNKFFSLDVVFGDDILVVFGDASGVDFNAKQFAINHGIRYKEYKADWKKYFVKGRPNPAGPIRNEQMVSEHADAAGILIFPGGKGTAGCASIAAKHGIKPIKFIYPEQ